jgi:flagellar biosynthesis regulator FlaF
VVGTQDYDHFGKLVRFCGVHGYELTGVRRRIAALLAQIEGMNRLVHFAAFADEQVNRELRATLVAQGVLLVQLIKRERELTGAAEPSK